MTPTLPARSQPSCVIATPTPDLAGGPRDIALADIDRPHLVCLLGTAYRCRWDYLRQALSFSEGRLLRHIDILRTHGYADSSQDDTGAGWAWLTPLGASRRDTQFAALADLPAVARAHLAAAHTTQPGWFTPRNSP